MIQDARSLRPQLLVQIAIAILLRDDPPERYDDEATSECCVTPVHDRKVLGRHDHIEARPIHEDVLVEDLSSDHVAARHPLDAGRVEKLTLGEFRGHYEVSASREGEILIALVVMSLGERRRVDIGGVITDDPLHRLRDLRLPLAPRPWKIVKICSLGSPRRAYPNTLRTNAAW
ncbi:MAG: hypothetical protein R6V44_11650 [Paracoccaceae bacterium]